MAHPSVLGCLTRGNVIYRKSSFVHIQSQSNISRNSNFITLCFSGPSCSKLTKSLVNISLVNISLKL